jgi:hypothetical protein
MLTSALWSISALGFSFAATGHQLVALICEHELTSKTRAAIGTILPTENLPEISPWADLERQHDPSTSGWHYIDYNIKTGKVEAQHANDPTILDAISSNSVALRSAESTETRQRALKFLVHFMADLHQPLHCADNNDAGGNKTFVSLRGEEIRLHRVWDGPVVERMIAERYPGKSLPEVAAILHSNYAAKKADFTSGTIEDWARESFEIARDHVYRLPPPAAEGKPPEIDGDYMRASEAIIEKRLALAGLRLAHVLNSLLDPDYRPTTDALGLGSKRAHAAPVEKVSAKKVGSQGALVPAGVH